MTIQGQSLKSQKEEKRIRMIQAAYELFSEKGVYKTSIDDIAKSAGVAKGTFLSLLCGQDRNLGSGCGGYQQPDSHSGKKGTGKEKFA